MKPQAAQRQPQMGSLLLPTKRYLGIHLTPGDAEIRRMILAKTLMKCGNCGFYLIELWIQRLLFHSGFVLRLFVLIRLQIPAEDGRVYPPEQQVFSNTVLSGRGRCGTVFTLQDYRRTLFPQQLSLIKFHTRSPFQFHSDERNVKKPGE